jgi:hypothetical protein
VGIDETPEKRCGERIAAKGVYPDPGSWKMLPPSEGHGPVMGRYGVTGLQRKSKALTRTRLGMGMLAVSSSTAGNASRFNRCDERCRVSLTRQHKHRS